MSYNGWYEDQSEYSEGLSIAKLIGKSSKMQYDKYCKNILNKRPISIKCPLCGEYHKWEGKNLGDYTNFFYKFFYMECCHRPIKGSVATGDDNLKIFVNADLCCNGEEKTIDFTTSLMDAIWDNDNHEIRIEKRIHCDEYFATKCNMCRYLCHCQYYKQFGVDEIDASIGFKFSEKDWKSIIGEDELEEDDLESEEDSTTQKDEESKNNNITKNKEDTVMATTLREQIYEHSPKENVELIKDFLERYKPTLRWAVPVACVYGAYRIVNSKDIDVNELSKKCKKEMGFEFEVLKDKKTLKELVALGGIVAGAYAFCKVLNFAGSTSSPSIEEIEEKMETVEEAHKKFDWIQPKVEKLMPVAVSVLVVYVLTQKPQWFEKAKEKVDNVVGDVSTKTGVYLDMARLFVSAKLNIDLDDEEQAKKFRAFAMLSAVVGVGAFLYGKGVFNMKDDESFMDKNPQVKEFIEQTKAIMEKILPTAFSAVTTYMVTKHIIDGEEEQTFEDEDKENKEDEDVVDGDSKEPKADTEAGTTWF